MKPFRVDFSYEAVETASMYIVAANSDDAALGALTMLEEYKNPNVVKVEEVKKPSETAPTLN